jgi:hypothetical protein
MKYIKSKTTDFSGILKESQFHQEILDSSISSSLVGVHTRDDEIQIEFSSELTSGEQTTLDNLISSHVPNITVLKSNFFTITPKTNTKSSSYSVISTFIYPGSKYVGPIDYIEVIAKIESKGLSYDVRIVNQETGIVLAEKTDIGNEEFGSTDMGTILNIPEEESILELQIKRKGSNKKIFIDTVIIYYDNETH